MCFCFFFADNILKEGMRSLLKVFICENFQTWFLWQKLLKFWHVCCCCCCCCCNCYEKKTCQRKALKRDRVKWCARLLIGQDYFPVKKGLWKSSSVASVYQCVLTLVSGAFILWYEEVFCVSEHGLIAKKEPCVGISCLYLIKMLTVTIQLLATGLSSLTFSSPIFKSSHR